MRRADWTVQQADSTDMSAAALANIRRLMDAAFGSRFSDEDWRHALGGRHFFIRGPGHTIVSHGSVIPRQVEASGHHLSTGYVEAVATQPEFQRQGLATSIMHAIADFIAGRFELGALSSGRPGFYEQLGWTRWRGATWYRDGEDLTRTAEEDGGVFALPTPATPQIDFGGDIAVEWRTGDVW